MTLANLTDTNNPNLTVNSEGSITLAGADLGTGTHTFNTDNNDNGTETLTVNDTGTFSVGAGTFRGGTGTNDTIDVNADVTAATTLTIQNAATVDLAMNVDITASSGALSVVTNVTQIDLSGAGGTNMLVANGAGGSVTVADIIDSGTPATLTIDGDQDVTVRNITLNSASNPVINVLANQDSAGGNSFSQVVGTSISTTNETSSAVSITVGNTGNANIRGITAGTTTGRVTISTGGAIVDADTDAAVNVTANEAILIGSTGIGGAGAGATIETDVDTLDFNNVTSGGVFITNSGALTLSDLNSSSATAVGGSVTASSPLFISMSITITASMSFTAGNSGSDGDDLTINNNAVLTLDSGAALALTMNAGDDIVFDTGSITTGAGVGPYAVALNGDQEGAGGDTDRGGVTQTGTTVSVTASTLSIVGPETIGQSGTPLHFNVNSLTTNSSALNGDQFVREVNSVTLTSINAGTGTFTMMTSGEFDLTTDAIANTTLVVVENGATLDVNGATDTVASVAVRTGGFLKGNGTLTAPVTANGGTVTPGLTAAVGPGVINTGNFAVNSGGTFAVEIDGPSAAGAGNVNGFDRVAVTGSVTLTANAFLTLDFSDVTFGEVVQGDQFIIILNDGIADAVSGTFNSLPDGALVASNLAGTGINAYITYFGGNGNDVAIVYSETNPNVDLTAYNPGVDDAFVVSRTVNTVQVRDRATNVLLLAVPVDSIGGALILTGENGAAEAFEIDFDPAGPSGGNPMDTTTGTIQITFNGGGPGGGDSLDLINVPDVPAAGSFTTHTYNYTNANDGDIRLDNGTKVYQVNYSGLEPISNDGTPNAIIFNLPGTADATITLSDLGGGVARLESTALTFEQTDFVYPAANGSIMINLGANGQTLSIPTLALNNNTSLTINGGDAADTVTLATGAGVLNFFNLSITAETINQTQGFTVNGATTLNASSTGTILLNNATNNFIGDVEIIDSMTATVLDSNDIQFTAITTGTLTVTSTTGDITDIAGATIAVNGLATFTAGDDITLGDNGTDTTNFGSLAASGDVVSISENVDMSITVVSGLTSVTLTSEAGGIIDNDGAGGNDISSPIIALTAMNGIGSANALETTDTVGPLATTLAFSNSTTGNVQIANTGALTIGSVGALTTSQNMAAAGTVSLSATSPITFAVNTSSVGSLLAQAIESVTTNFDHITVNGGVTVESTAGDVTFEAGDNVVISATATVRANAAGGDVTLDSGFGDVDSDGSMTLDGAITANSTNGVVTLDLNGTTGATQSNGAITGNGLRLLSTGGSGSFSLTRSTNNVNTIAANTAGSISYRDNDGLTVGTVTTIGITTSNDNVTLQTGTTLTIDDAISLGAGTLTLNAGGAATQNAGDTIAAAGLELLGTGPFTLNEANDVTNLAANTSSVSLTDVDDVIVATVGGTTGVTTTGGFTINAGDDVQINAATMVSAAISLTAGGDDNTLSINAAVSAGASSAFTADKMAIGATVTVGANTLTLASESTADSDDAINLGSGTDLAADTLELSDSELDQITATTIVVGSVNTRVITVSAAFTQAAKNLSLTNGGANLIDFTGGSLSTTGIVTLTTSATGGVDSGTTMTDITASTLNITAGSLGIGANGNPLAMSVTTLVTNSAAAAVNQFLSEADSLTWNTSSAGTGTIDLAGGRFNVGSSSIITAATVNVNSGATLGGSGSVSAAVSVAGGGTVSPGSSVAILNTNSVSFAAGSNFDVEIDGTSGAGVVNGHDQLNVTGTTALGAGNATLNLSGTYTPVAGNTFTIIQSSGAVSGTFNGLADLDDVFFNNQPLEVDYQTNAVVLSFDDTPVVNGTAGDDVFVVSQDGAGNIVVVRNSATVMSTPEGSLFNLVINGLAGDDTLRVDFTGAGAEFFLPVIFNGGGQTTAAGDALTVLGGTFPSLVYDATNVGAGALTFIDGLMSTNISFTGLEPVTVTSVVSTVTINIDPLNNIAGAITTTISDTTGSNMLVSTDVGLESLTFTTPTVSLTVNGDNGATNSDDTITVASVDADAPFRAALTINGRQGDDVINIDTSLLLGSAASTGNLRLTAEAINLNAASIRTDNVATAGNVTLSGTNININDDLTIDTNTTTDGTLTVTGSITGIPQTLTLDLGDSSFDDGGGSLNDYGTVVILSAANVSLVDVGFSLSLGDVNVTGNLSAVGDFGVFFGGNGASSVGGDLTLDAASLIDDTGTGSLTVTGLSTFSGAGSVSLNNAGNDFSSVVLPDGNVATATLNDINGINIDGPNNTGLLTITAGGLVDFIGSGVSTFGALDITTTANGIDDSGTGSLTVTGTATLDVGTTNNITLNNALNNFATVVITSGNNVSLRDASAIDLDTSTVTGNLNVNAGGLVDFVGTGATTVGGTLGITTTAGGIDDSGTGSLAVTNTTSLTTGVANSITLDNQTNNFNLAVTIVSANNVSLDDDADISLSTITADGNLTIDAGGNVTFNGLVNVMGNVDVQSDANGTNGTIDLNAKLTAGGTVLFDADDNITIDAAIDPTTVTLLADDDITISAAVVATTLITVTAGADGTGTASVAAAGSLTTSGGGSDIAVTSGATSGNISLAGNVSAVDRVTLTSQAGVSQTGAALTAANLLLLGAGTFTLTRSGNDVDTVAADLAGGAISLVDSDSIVVGTVGTVGISTGNPAAGGAVTINATSGTITVSNAIDTTTGSGGGISITGSVTLNAGLTAGAGTITLNGNTAATSDLTINAALVSSGSMTLSAPRDIIVAALVQTTGVGSDITLTADSDDDSVGGVQIQMAGQVDANDVVTIIGSDLFASGGAVDSVDIVADGMNNQVLAGGNIAIGNSAVAPTTADVFVNGRVTTTGAAATIGLTSQNDITFAATGDVTGVGGAITVTAAGSGTGVITMADGAIINAGSATITLTAEGTITLGSVQTTNASAAAVTITSTLGGIADGGDTDVDIVAGGRAVLTAATGIGAGNAIETTIASLDASVTGAGNLQITETDLITLFDVDTANGAITVNAGGAITASDVVSTNDLDANDISLTAATGNVIVVSINAGIGNGDVILTATLGSIVDDGVNGTGITADDANLTAALAVGDNVGSGQLDTTINSVTALASAGGVYIGESNGLTVTSATSTGAGNNVEISTTTGNITVVSIASANDVFLTATAAGGSIVDDDNDGTVISGNVVNLTANTRIGQPLSGTAVEDIDTTATTVNGSTVAVGANNGIWITETDTVNFNNVSTADGITALRSGGTMTATNLSAGGAVNGDVRLTTTAGDIQVITVTAADDVFLTSAAAITEDGVPGTLLTGDVLTAVAATGITLGTAVNTLVATNNTSGNILVQETSGLIIGGTGVRTLGGNGNITVNVAAGTLDINSVVTADGSGTVTLTSAGLLTANAVISSTSGALSLTGGTGVTHTAAGDLTTGTTGTINVTVTTGDVTMADGTIYTTGSGTVTVLAATNVLLSEITTTSSAINVTATAGAITDNTAAETANLTTTGTATLVAATGIGSAGGAADIDTMIGTLVATNNTSGNIFVQETSGLIIAGTGVRTLGGNGNINVDVTAGTLDVNSVVTANGSGTVTLSSGGLLTANAVISATSGALSLTGGTGVTHTAAGDLTTGTTGTITVTATTGDVTMADGTVYSTGSGTVTVLAATNVVLGEITTTSSAINVTATAGAITEATAAETANLTTSGTATLSAATGIGSAGGAADIDTTIATLVATNSTSGNVFVQETSGLIIGGTGVRTTGGNGNINVDVTAGALDVNSVVTADGSGTVTLSSGGLLTANAVISSTSGAFSLTGGTGVTHTAAGDLTTGTTGTITVTATTGDVTMADGTIYSTGSGTVTVLAATNVLLGEITTTSSAINVTATAGAISDNTAAETANLTTSGTATLSAATGIGSAGGAADIDTTIGTLVATNNTSGNIVVQETSGLIIGGTGVRTLGGNGNINVDVTAGALDVNSVVTANGSGTVTLNAAGLLTANAAISSTSGALSLTGGTGVTHTAAGDLTTSLTGTINVTATTGDVTMADGTIYTTGSGTVTVLAGTNVVLGEITATSSSINITATAGAITETTSAETANLTTSGTATLSAAAGIGSTGGAADIDTTIGTLVATNSTSGNIFVQESSGLIIGGTGVRTLGGNGNINVDVTAGALDVNSVVTANGSGTVTVSSGGLLTANAVISSTSGALSLTGGTGVTHTTAGDLTTGAAGTITVMASTGDVTMADGTIYTAGSGTVTVLAATNVVLGQINTTSSAINITATAGAITETTAAETANLTTSGTVTLSATTGIASANGVGDIDTAIGTLVATNSTSGNIFVQETSGLIIGGTGVRTLGGNGNINVDVTAGALDVNSVVTADGSGTVTLNAAGLLTANAAISSTNGALTLTGGTGVTHTAAGDLTTGTTGTISVTATTGDVTMADGTVYTTGSGTVTVLAATNVLLGEITTTSSSINVTATAGAITETTAAETANLTTSGTATLVAATGIGSAGGANDIDTTIGTLVATNNTSGNIFVQETNGLIIGGTGVRTLGGNGNINVDIAAGSLDLNSVVTANGSGTVTLNSAGLLTANAVISSTSGALSLTGGTGVTHTAAGDLTTGTTGTITVTATTGDVTMADGTIYSTGSGTVTVLAATNVVLGEITTTSSSINVTATAGAITETTVAETTNLTSSGTATLSAATGIGSAGGAADIDTTIGTLVATNNTSGNIFVQETSGLIIGGTGVRTLSSNGNINVNVSAGTLDVNSVVTADGSGTVTLSSGGLLTANAVVSSTSGALSLTGGTGVTHTANGDLTTGTTATISVTATSGNVAMADGTIFTTGSGTVTVVAATNVVLGEITTTSSAINLTATAGAITETTAAETANLTTTNTVTMSAVTGIGSAGGAAAIDTTIGTLVATNTTSGNIIVQETSGLIIGGTGVRTLGGNGIINVNSGAGPLDVNSIVAANGSGTVTLSSGGLLTASAVISSASGALSLTGGTGVSHTATGDLTTGTTGTINVTASTGDVTMVNGTVYTTGSGAVTVQAAANVVLGEIATGSSTAVVTATAGAVSDINGAAANVTANSLAVTASTGVGSGDALETQITNLAYRNTTSGNVVIANTGALTVASVGLLVTSTNAGATSLSATSPITFAVNSTQASITAQALESGTTNTDNITVNATVVVTATTGDVIFEAGDRIVITATGTVTATAGNVTFDSGFGDTDNDGSMTLSGAVNAGTTITLDLNQEGAATQALTGSLVAPNLLLLSNTSSSASFALGTSTLNNVTNLAANTSASINYREAGSVNVDTVGGTMGIATGNGVAPGTNVTINATSGNLIINQPITTAPGAGGGITISGGVTVNAALSAGAGTITLNGSTAASVDLTSLGNLTAGGSIALSAPRDVIISALVQTTGLGSDITITADTNSDGVGGVRIATAGFVTSNDAVTISGSNLFVTATGDPDSVEIQSDGATNQVIGGGNVLIGDGTAAPATAQTIVNGLVASTSGTVTITAEDDVLFGADGDLVTSGGTITVTADTRAGNNGGGITMVDGSVINAGSGLIVFTADGTITLGSLTTTNSSTTAIQVTSANGAITDGGNTDVDIVAADGRAVLTARTGIGSANAIETTIGSLDASVTGGGSLQINETDLITLFDVDTQNGSITITSGGTMTAVDVVSTTSLDANDISLTTTSGSIEVGIINAGSVGDVSLTAATAVTDGDNNSLITADDLSITASSGAIGGNGAPINTSVNDLTANSSATGGDQYFSEANTLSVGTLATATPLTAGTGTLHIVDGEFDLTVNDMVNNSTSITVEVGAVLSVGSDVTETVTAVTVLGTLQGRGTLTVTASPVTVGDFGTTGTVSPGTSPGILSIVGDVVFTTGSQFAVELTSPYALAGSHYDQLDVTGTVDLGGATLSLTGSSGSSAAGLVQTIVNNDGTDAVSNTFDGLEDGAAVGDGGYDAFISYFGGDGNDVILAVFTDRVTIDGTTGDDEFKILRVQNTVQVFLGTVLVDARPISSVNSYFINGLEGDDSLTIDFLDPTFSVFNNPIPNGGVVFDGGANGTTGDSLLLTNTGDTFTRNTYSYANATDGSIALFDGVSDSIVSFSGVEPVSNDGTPTELIFNLTESSDAGAALQDDSGPIAGLMLLGGPTIADTTFDISLASSVVINGNSGTDVITVVSFDSLFNASLTINGDAGNDTLNATLSSKAVTLNGGVGNDSLLGSTRGDSLSGDSGNDVVRGLGGNDSLAGGSGTNTLDGGVGDDCVVEVVTGNAVLTNTSFVNIGKNTLISIECAELFGNSANNLIDASGFTPGVNVTGVTLHGGAGNDTLIGTGKSDSLLGDAGSDTVRYKFTKKFTTPSITASDVLLSDNDSDDTLESIEALDLTAHASVGTVINALIFNGYATLNGGSGKDVLTAGNRDSVLKGNAGNDNLNGGAGWDSLYGGIGNDTMSGGSGNDNMRGDDGNDSIEGGAGDDNLSGEAGRDRISGGSGQDVINGGNDADTLLGGDGHDTISGGAGNDIISGGNGDDRVYGDAGNDTLLGDEGDDVLVGSGGRDLLLGGGGNDRLDGGSDKDTLAGQGGDDTIGGSPDEINEFFIFDIHRLLI